MSQHCFCHLLFVSYYSLTFCHLSANLKDRTQKSRDKADSEAVSCFMVTLFQFFLFLRLILILLYSFSSQSRQTLNISFWYVNCTSPVVHSTFGICDLCKRFSKVSLLCPQYIVGNDSISASLSNKREIDLLFSPGANRMPSVVHLCIKSVSFPNSRLFPSVCSCSSPQSYSLIFIFIVFF